MSKTPNQEALGRRIKRIRQNLGLSQQEVADYLNLHRPSISQIENGERDLSAYELSKMSELFGLPMEEIIDSVKTKDYKKPKSQKTHKGDIKITFFRHGEAVDDIYNQYGGWADPELSPKGVSKAYHIARRIKENDINFDIIYTSPLKRARRKAEVIGRELRTDVKVLQYLKERNTYGLLCGINKEVAQKRFPNLVKAYESGEYVHGSERYDDFVKRIDLLFEYLNKSKFQNICCVSHGKLLSAVIKEKLNMKPEKLDDGCMLVVGLNPKNINEIYYVQSEGISFGKS